MVAKNHGFQTNYKIECPSTNEWAKQENPNQKSLFTCDEQSRGKGRFDRVWESTKQQGQLFCSWTFPLDEAKFTAPILTGILLHKHLLSDGKIKLPNDLYLNNKKVIGILCESLQKNSKNLLVVGIGINLFSAPDIEKADYIAKYSPVDRDDFLQKLCQAMIELETALKLPLHDFKDYLIKNAYVKNQENILEIDDNFTITCPNHTYTWSDL